MEYLPVMSQLKLPMVLHSSTDDVINEQPMKMVIFSGSDVISHYPMRIQRKSHMLYKLHGNPTIYDLAHCSSYS